ncbi:MAG: PilZ domain-containing protein [Erythrobacter sp.]|uniref:PilZ domain-containing protein n=1 Tax=Erythrobacter sp. TaxID=1042 RepID=UPI003296C7CE
MMRELGNAQDASAEDQGPDLDLAFEQQTRSLRHNLVIRAGKLVSPHGEFVCVVRDVSETGVGLRLFHDPPTGEPLELQMPDGGTYEIRQVREDGNHVGYEFVNVIDVPRFLVENPDFPKRGLRLNLAFPVTVRSLAGTNEGLVENLSQHGARLSCEGIYAIDQNLFVDCPEDEVRFREVGAKVRWRRDSEYGVVFENTLSLEEFAKLAAELQCPDLLRSDA